MKTIKTLSGVGSEIKYEHGFCIKWGKINFSISDGNIDDILKYFFKDKNKWYPLGSSETKPMLGGLGEYIYGEFPNLNSRHASAIAAIMCEEKLIEAKDKKPILLKKK